MSELNITVKIGKAAEGVRGGGYEYEVRQDGELTDAFHGCSKITGAIDCAISALSRIRAESQGIVTIQVCGKQFPTDKSSLTYEEVLSYAGYRPDRILSVIYINSGNIDKREGSLTPNNHVQIQEGTRFEVADTSNA